MTSLRAPIQIERLLIRQSPPAALPMDTAVRVRLELADDMGRMVMVQSAVQISVSVQSTTPDGDLSSTHGVVVTADAEDTAARGDQLAQTSGHRLEIRAGESGCTALLKFSLPHGPEADGPAVRVFLVFTASSSHNPTGRVALGMFHTILPAAAGPCTVVAPPGTSALSEHAGLCDHSLAPLLRLVPFNTSGGGRLPLLVSEDALAHGHGTHHTWGTTWDSGVVLAACLERVLQAEGKLNDPSRYRAVEIGCGGGVVGLATAKLGMRTVLTDGEPGALKLTDQNIASNELSDLASSATLWWGDLDQGTALVPPFDIVLAADVAYQEELFQPLVHTLLQLTGPQSLVLLSFRRRTGGVKALFDILGQHFSVDAIPDDLYHPTLRAADIIVFRMARLPSHEDTAEAADPLQSTGRARTHADLLAQQTLQYSLEARGDEGQIEVVVRLPREMPAADVQLEVVGGSCLEVTAPEHEGLQIALPVAVDEGSCVAKFSRKKHALTVLLTPLGM